MARAEVTAEDVRAFLVDELRGLFPHIADSDEDVKRLSRFLEGTGQVRVVDSGGIHA